MLNIKEPRMGLFFYFLVGFVLVNYSYVKKCCRKSDFSRIQDKWVD